MKIALIGACDRNNYGDLLMPIVFEKQYRYKNPDKDVKFEYYGQIDSDMSYVKSNNTKALYRCYNNCDIAIMVGGEILSSNFKLMYFNLQKNPIKIFIMRCFNKIFPHKMEEISKKKLKGKSERPWILDKDTLGCKKIIYNTVGGDFDNNVEIIKNIKKIDYMAIRNKVDFDKISKYNKNVYLYPDSVTAISKVISSKEIEDNVSEKIKKMAAGIYFIIQIDKRDGKKIVGDMAKQINEVCDKLKMDCILLPIGYAQGHEDQVVLKKVLKKCHNKNVLMPGITNIYETIYIIKNSCLFIGTSLHGIITSTSYCVPHMFLTSKIKKVLNYLDTWTTTPLKYTEVEDIAENVEKILSIPNLKENLEEKSRELIRLVDENFKNINDLINEEIKNEKRN